GVTTTGATLLGPGLVRLGGEGTISLEAHPRLAALEAMLRAAGFAINVVADARSLLWGKLVVNAAINPLTALLRVPNGELLQRPTARFLMGELAREAAAVARAQGVSLPFEAPGSAAEEVARRTAANRSSMLQDVLRGAPTEIDAICGAIVHSGQAAGMPAPLNRVMWHLVGALAGNPPQG
ncbi:MAG: 2-dehydropantoate 2-reductase, partial [Anaerolineales bacterium]|nr:2-dehydropantoate 2-reductase [Anaerolineales bacterium]